MKKVLFSNFLLFFSITLVNAQVFDNLSVYSHISQNEKISALKHIHYNSKGTGSNYNVIYHRCNWTIDPSIYYIQGNVTTYFKPETAISSVDFDLSVSLTVDSVKYHGANMFFTHNADLLIINLPQQISANTTDSITVYYKGAPQGGGFGSFTQAPHGTNNAFIIWTLSEPYGASDWWPCKETLDDKIDSIDIYVVSPLPYRTASNGVLVSETTSNGFTTCHWKHRYPIANYLVAIAVTNYAIFTDKAKISATDSITIYNYVYPEDSSSIRPAAALVVQPMEFFSEKFIPYPFASEKYGQAQFGWGGGMEHQTMTFLGYFYYSIMAHELAHQWFGDYITCGSWQDIWLNEGFATYLDALTVEEFFPNEFPNWKNQVINYVTSMPGGSVFCYDTTDVNRIFNYRLTYLKAAFVLHMLRTQIGDEAFFQAVRNYLNDPGIANGFAFTPQLISHFENTSGTSLTNFFNDWVYGEGYPLFNVNYYFYHQNRLALNILQQPSINTAGVFELPLQIKIDGKNKDTLLTIQIVSDNQLLFFDDLGIDSIAAIIVDPYSNILTKNPTVTTLQTLPEISKLQVFPIPATQYINFVFPTNQTPEEIIIRDFSGCIKLRKKTGTEKIFSADISAFTPGIYIAHIQTSKGYEIVKFIKK